MDGPQQERRHRARSQAIHRKSTRFVTTLLIAICSEELLVFICLCRSVKRKCVPVCSVVVMAHVYQISDVIASIALVAFGSFGENIYAYTFVDFHSSYCFICPDGLVGWAKVNLIEW